MSGETAVGDDVVSGYRAVRVVRNNFSSWYAPDQGCALVKLTVDWGKVKNEQELVSIVPGEPLASLFDVPANYREVPPSQLACSFASEDSLDRPCDPSRSVPPEVDAEYFSHRPH